MDIAIAVFLSVLCATLGALKWKRLDNEAKGVSALPRLEAAEQKLLFLEGQLGETQRACVKVDNKLVKLAQAAGHGGVIK